MNSARRIVYVLCTVSIVFLQTPGGDLLEESFCAGVPYGDEFINGMESIGGENIFLPGFEYINNVWVANRNESVFSHTNGLHLDVRGVRDQSGNVVNGWLSLQLSQKKKGTPFIAAAVWALTEKGQSIGEFVHPSFVDCKGRPSFSGRINYLPCSGVPLNSPMYSNMFVYSTSQKPTETQFNVLWRVSFTYCNYVKRFRIMVAGTTDKFPTTPPKNYESDDGKLSKWGLYHYTSGWIEPSYYGPAGSIPIDGGPFDCSSSKNIGEEKLDWLEKIFPSTLTMGDLEPFWFTEAWVNKGRTYQAAIDTRRAVCKAPENSRSKYGGRCTTLVDISSTSNSATSRKYAKIDWVQECHTSKEQPPPPEPELFNYLNAIKKRDQEVSDNCRKCPPVPTREEVINAKQTGGKTRTAITRRKKKEPDSKPGIDPPTNPYVDDALRCQANDSNVNPDEAGLCLNSVAGKVVYGVRQWHAVTMLVCFVLINPIVTFRARYLKGYYSLNENNQVPLGSWYKFHITTLLPVICMFTSSMGAISRQKSLFGYSVTSYGYFHRFGGYFLFVLWFFLVLTGSLRPVRQNLRKCFITLHWAGGWTYQYFGLLSCILTYRIPGSPTSFHSHVAEREKFKTLWNNMAPTILLIWGVIDISFHIVLTIHVMRFDKKMGHKRSVFPIIVPLCVNRKEMALDIKEAFNNEVRFYENMLTLYVVFALISFISCCVSIYNFNVGLNQGFGWMYCTHNDEGAIGQVDRSNDYWYCT